MYSTYFYSFPLKLSIHFHCLLHFTFVCTSFKFSRLAAAGFFYREKQKQKEPLHVLVQAEYPDEKVNSRLDIMPFAILVKRKQSVAFLLPFLPFLLLLVLPFYHF